MLAGAFVHKKCSIIMTRLSTRDCTVAPHLTRWTLLLDYTLWYNRFNNFSCILPTIRLQSDHILNKVTSHAYRVKHHCWTTSLNRVHPGAISSGHAMLEFVTITRILHMRHCRIANRDNLVWPDDWGFDFRFGAVAKHSNFVVRTGPFTKKTAV